MNTIHSLTQFLTGTTFGPGHLPLWAALLGVLVAVGTVLAGREYVRESNRSAAAHAAAGTESAGTDTAPAADPAGVEPTAPRGHLRPVRFTDDDTLLAHRDDADAFAVYRWQPDGTRAHVRDFDTLPEAAAFLAGAFDLHPYDFAEAPAPAFAPVETWTVRRYRPSAPTVALVALVLAWLALSAVTATGRGPLAAPADAATPAATPAATTGAQVATTAPVEPAATTGAPTAQRLPMCPQEDSPGPCVWDARHTGNGVGHSFRRTASGHVVYLPHATAHRLAFGE